MDLSGEYTTDLDDGHSGIFERYFLETNAHRHLKSPDMSYLVTEEEVPVVYEIRDANGDYSGSKALLLEDVVLEGQLSEEKVGEIRDYYESLRS